MNAWAIHYFVHEVNLFVRLFAKKKNFSIYNARIGHYDIISKFCTQMTTIIRLNLLVYDACIVATILNNPILMEK